MSQLDERWSAGTLQLVADVAILLNLIYSRIADTSIPQIHDRDAVLGDLPPCLSSSADRMELFGRCSEGCDARLCPFPSSRSGQPHEGSSATAAAAGASSASAGSGCHTARRLRSNGRSSQG
jgi:hypothetical protein